MPTTTRGSTGFFASTLALVLLFSTQVGVSAEKPIVIRFSHVVTDHTPKGMGANRFKELVEQRSTGAVRVEVYPNSQLYKDSEEMQALHVGAVQMVAPALGKLGLLGLHGFEVFDLPFMIPDHAALVHVTRGPVGRGLLKTLESRGFIGLGYWDNGFKIMSANRPLRMPADFHGLKMRIQSSKILDAQMRALGAIPQVLAFSEVYQGLQTGIVDGTENTASNMFTQRHYEVQKFLTLSNHGYIGYAVVVNKRFWDGLPPDIRSLLEAAMSETTEYVNQIARQENEASLVAMQASGRCEFIQLSEIEREAWRSALQAVHEKMASRIGPQLLAEVEQAVAESKATQIPKQFP